MKIRIPFILFLVLVILSACQSKVETEETATQEVLIMEEPKRIPIQTPKGQFDVFTQRVGSNPAIKILLLHGGPGMTHQQFANFKDYLPQEGVEFIWYDQLGSAYSDQPSDSSLWTIERFVDEVEQVRQALGLNKDNFYLYGQSWGGMLAIEYALAHQESLKGLIISNMMASIVDYESMPRRF